MSEADASPEVGPPRLERHRSERLHVAAVVWYRFRATFSQRLGGYLAVVLVLGMIGGLGLGALAAARRTQSSFSTYLASTNPSDLYGGTAVYSPAGGPGSGYSPSVVHAVEQLPHVTRVESYSGLLILPLQRSGAPISPDVNVTMAGSVDGLYFNQDKVTLTQGRMSNPNDPDQVVLSSAAAALLGMHVGEVVPFGVYTDAQEDEPAFGTSQVKPHLRIDIKVVGLVVFNTTVIEDDTDAAITPEALFTPALTRALLDCCVNYTNTGIQESGESLASLQAKLLQVLPGGFLGSYQSISQFETKAAQALRPISIALAVFGGIALVAGLLIACQAIGRQLRLDANDGARLRSIGADPAMTVGDGLIGTLGSVVLGSLLAVGVAVALSPLAPLGAVRPVYPNRGINADWTVLGFGFAALALVVSTFAVSLARYQAPHREAQRPSIDRGSRLVARAVGSGLPVSAVTGIGLAFEAGTGRRSVPIRSAILGAVLAMVVVVATVTFGASLDTLVSHPALYGWNWTYALSAGTGVGDVPAKLAVTLLDRDRDISGWTGVNFATVQIGGQTVPTLGASPGAAVTPPVLSGHGLEASNQIVLGSSTLTRLHKQVGESILVDTGSPTPVRLQIVGTASLPTIGVAGDLHLTMGTGAVLADDLIPAAAKNVFGDPIPGPNFVLVRLRKGSDPAASLRGLQQIATELSNNANFGVLVVPVQRPAQIVNYRSMGTTPAILGAALAAGAVGALGLTLVASVRRRRRDLALLKTLGFAQRQLVAVVSWQASIVVALGTVVGVPLGIALGRTLWDVFATDIHAVPEATIPALSITLVAIGALLLANLVALVPGRMATRTPTALALRTE